MSHISVQAAVYDVGSRIHHLRFRGLVMLRPVSSSFPPNDNHGQVMAEYIIMNIKMPWLKGICWAASICLRGLSEKSVLVIENSKS